MTKKKKITIGRLLERSKDIPIGEIPFAKEVLYIIPDDVDVDYRGTAMELAEKLKANHQHIMNLKLEDILVDDEYRATRRLVRYSFIIGLLSTFGTLVTILYLSILTQTVPDGWLMIILTIIPAMIMWTRAGVLKSENANSVSKILSGVFNKTGVAPHRSQKQQSQYLNEDDL